MNAPTLLRQGGGAFVIHGTYPHHMAGDAYGYTTGAPAAHWQKVLNQSWPNNPRGLPHHQPINITARIMFEHDGETWLNGTADRWVGQNVCVEIDDPRLQVRYVWVDAVDVKRR